MIAAISRMGSAAALARYLHGPGRHNEHRYQGRPGGAVIAGTACARGALDGTTWAKDFHRTAAGADSDRVRRSIWHCSLRAAPTDRAMDDAEWRTIAHEFVGALGIEALPWVAIRHGDDHVHLAVCRVGDDGRVWAGQHDRRLAQQACTAIEQIHQLVKAPRLRSRTRRSEESQIRSGEHGKAQRTGQTPQRVVLAEKVIAVVQNAAGRGRDGFEAECARMGITAAANVASGTGRMSGYTFTDTSVPEADRLVFKASQLHKCLSWTQLASVLDEALARPVDTGAVYSAARRRLDGYAVGWRNRAGVPQEPTSKAVPDLLLQPGRYDTDTRAAVSLAATIRTTQIPSPTQSAPIAPAGGASPFRGQTSRPQR